MIGLEIRLHNSTPIGCYCVLSMNHLDFEEINKIIKVNKKVLKKHNNLKIILFISAKLPCATCGGFPQIASHIGFSM